MECRFARLVLIILLAGTVRSFAAPPELKYRFVPQAAPAIEVNSVSVSPDGLLVASAADDVRLYDARTGKLLRVLSDVGDRHVAFSPDGRNLTAAGFHMDKLVAVWDVQSGRRVRTFAGQTEWEADATAISRDGKLLASTGVDKQILVWEIATGKLRLRLANQPARMAALAFSPDSGTLAAAGGDRSIHLWDCATGKARGTLTGQSDWICTLAFAPDGKSLASGSCDWGSHRGQNWPRPPWRGAERCEWILWDLWTGTARRKVHDGGRLLSLAFAPDGKSLACGIGREVRLYGISPDASARVVTVHDSDVTSVAFTPDGEAIVSGSHDQTIRFTRLATGVVEWHAPGYFEVVNSVALSAKASLLVTGSSDWRFARGSLLAGARQIGPGAVRLWDMRTGRLLRRLGDTSDQFMAVAISPDSRHVAAGCGIKGGKGAVRVWEVDTGSLVWSTEDHTAEVLALAFSRDGTSLATGAADGLVKVRDAQRGTVRQTLSGHAGGATALTFSPDGATVFCGQAQGGTRIWNARSGELLQSCQADSRATSFTVDRQVNSIGLSRDGATLAMCASSTNGEYDSPLKLWDVNASRFTAELPGIIGRPMALSPDGSLIATGGKSVKLWDAHSGKLIRELYGYLKRTQSIVFSADGNLLVAGGSYGTTNLWQVATGRHLATLFAFDDPQSGAPTDDWLAYTPEGYYAGSPNVARFLAWRVGDELLTPRSLAHELHRPELVITALGMNHAQQDLP
jgi:WD40 repeat protein